MRETQGGVSLESVLDMTFPDLVDLWCEVTQTEQVREW